MKEETAYHGTAEPLRDFVAECLNMTAFYAAMAVDYAAARDDPGLAYATRRAVASLRQGVNVLKMLDEKNADILRSRQAAKASRDGADQALGL